MIRLGVTEAISAIARGEIVVVTDDKDRENEGDLIMAAEAATTDRIAFFLHHTSGVLCTALEPDRATELDLPLMVEDNREGQGTAFTVSVDLREGITTGISSHDRAKTIQALADVSCGPSDFVRPGHVFPLRARAGGVLKRSGHTEAAVDLARLAGCVPAGLLCEIVDESKQSMARGDELRRLASSHDLVTTSVADLIEYRLRSESLVDHVSEATVPTKHGRWRCHVWRSKLDGIEHMALVKGQIGDAGPVLVRVHSECLTGDAFGSRRCDCGDQLDDAMRIIDQDGRGVIVYLRGHEGRGIGLGHKLAAYALQDGGLDTVDANLRLGFAVDSREYGIGAQILVALGVRQIRLMTNNPAKYSGLAGYGLEIVDRVARPSRYTPDNVAYLRTKRDRMGHLMEPVFHSGGL